VGKELKGMDEFVSAAQRVREQGTEIILVSMGEREFSWSQKKSSIWLLPQRWK